VGLISDLVVFTETQSKTVAVALLGAIVVGGIGGVLWINNLKSALEQKDRIIQQKNELVLERRLLLEEKYQNVMGALRQENVAVSRELEVVSRSTNAVSGHLMGTLELLRELLEASALDSKNTAELVDALRDLEQHSLSIEQALERAQVVSDLAQKIVEVRIKPLGDLSEGRPVLMFLPRKVENTRRYDRIGKR